MLWWLPPSWAVWIYTVILKPAPLRAAVQKIICRLIPKELEVKGVALVLNQNDAIVSGNLALGCYESYNLDLFADALRPGLSVLAVGANIGLYAAIAARTVGPTGRVVAVEPDPVNCSFIERTKRRNSFSNMTIVQKAAGAQNGNVFLYLCATNKADHRVYAREGTREKISVEMTTLDSLAAELQSAPVDIMKIDTQGFELFVARGMQHLVEASPALQIFMEFWPWGIKQAGGSPRDLLDFFTSRGFQIATIDATKKQVDALRSYDEMLNLTLERQHANLYLSRKPGT
jgi:FkbM family methyltransferase